MQLEGGLALTFPIVNLNNKYKRKYQLERLNGLIIDYRRKLFGICRSRINSWRGGHEAELGAQDRSSTVANGKSSRFPGNRAGMGRN